MRRLILVLFFLSSLAYGADTVSLEYKLTPEGNLLLLGDGEMVLKPEAVDITGGVVPYYIYDASGAYHDNKYYHYYWHDQAGYHLYKRSTGLDYDYWQEWHGTTEYGAMTCVNAWNHATGAYYAEKMSAWTFYKKAVADPDDLDGDGWGNDRELMNGRDPNDANSRPKDSDGDGFSDVEEWYLLLSNTARFDPDIYPLQGRVEDSLNLYSQLPDDAFTALEEGKIYFATHGVYNFGNASYGQFTGQSEFIKVVSHGVVKSLTRINYGFDTGQMNYYVDPVEQFPDGDHDEDGIINVLDAEHPLYDPEPDSDGDGWGDREEKFSAGDPGAVNHFPVDSDGDGVSDILEMNAGTNPNLNTSTPTYSAIQLILDAWELIPPSSYQFGTGKHYYAATFGKADGLVGNTVLWWANLSGNDNPNWACRDLNNPDSPWIEYGASCYPINGIEQSLTGDYLTDGLLNKDDRIHPLYVPPVDSDGDGWSDYREIYSGSLINKVDDKPVDSDGDGFSDVEEMELNTNRFLDTSKPSDSAVTVLVALHSYLNPVLYRVPVNAIYYAATYSHGNNVSVTGALFWKNEGTLTAPNLYYREVTGGQDEIWIQAGSSRWPNNKVLQKVDGDFDGDGIVNNEDLDHPLYNTEEIGEIITEPLDDNFDSDDDGWSDDRERLAGSDPEDDSSVPLDSDGDDVTDKEEELAGTGVNDPWDRPSDSEVNRIYDPKSDYDLDGDGWTNQQEDLSGSDQYDAEDQPLDTDGDGASDAEEELLGTDEDDPSSVPDDSELSEKLEGDRLIDSFVMGTLFDEWQEKVSNRLQLNKFSALTEPIVGTLPAWEHSPSFGGVSMYDIKIDFESLKHSTHMVWGRRVLLVFFCYGCLINIIKLIRRF
jgi:hypothetical protein